MDVAVVKILSKSKVSVEVKTSSDPSGRIEVTLPGTQAFWRRVAVVKGTPAPYCTSINLGLKAKADAAAKSGTEKQASYQEAIRQLDLAVENGAAGRDLVLVHSLRAECFGFRGEPDNKDAALSAAVKTVADTEAAEAAAEAAAKAEAERLAAEKAAAEKEAAER